MKIILDKETNLCLYSFEDDYNIEIGDENVKIDKHNYIGYLNSDNCILVENVELPEDWKENKFVYNNSEWILNSNWSEPNVIE